MRKVLIVLLMLCILNGCYLKDEHAVITKHADAVIDMFEDKQTFIIYVGTGGCDSCKKYIETVEKVMNEYDVQFYYCPIDEKEYKSQINTLIYDYFNFFVSLTPTTFLVREGTMIAYRETELDYNTLVDWLDRNEYIRK